MCHFYLLYCISTFSAKTLPLLHDTNAKVSPAINRFHLKFIYLIYVREKGDESLCQVTNIEESRPFRKVRSEKKYDIKIRLKGN